MSHADFIHLRNHSGYSLLEGALKVKDLVQRTKDHDMPAVAITDTGNLFGALEFSSACMINGIQPIIGTQLEVLLSHNVFLSEIFGSTRCVFRSFHVQCHELIARVSCTHAMTQDEDSSGNGSSEKQ